MIIITQADDPVESEIVANMISYLLTNNLIKSISTNWAGPVERNVIELRPPVANEA